MDRLSRAPSTELAEPGIAAGGEERLAAQTGSRLRGRPRLVVAALWLVMLLMCVTFALIQPVWSRVDEAQHYSYVQYLAENRSLPVEGKTFITPAAVQISLKEDQWGWAPAGLLSTPARLNPSQWSMLPAGLSDQNQEKWVRRNLWYFNYEAMQPPLYYAVNVPLYAALPADPLVKLYGMRLLAALLASTILPLSYLTAREAFPESRLALWGTPVIVLLTQGFALNMSQMSNDALAVPLAAAGVLLLLRMTGRGLATKRSLLAGAVIAAALLTKLTTVFLLPLALLPPVLLVYYKRESIRRALLQTGLMTAPVAALMAPWMLHNLFLYGDTTGASAARPLMSSFFASPLTSLGTLRLNELLPTFWFGEPVFPFSYWTLAWIAIGPAMVVAIAGVLFFLTQSWRRQVKDVQIRILFLVLALVIGVSVNLMLPFGSGIGGVPGRYLYPLLPVIAFLLIFGIDRLLRRERARFLAEGMLVWMVLWEALNFVAYIQNR
ncbi:MAG: DUF2142 domain-containing protein [Thermoleophilia bacterium]